MPYTELIHRNAKAVHDYVGDIENMINGLARSDTGLLSTYGLVEETANKTFQELLPELKGKVFLAADEVRDVVNQLEKELERGPSEQTKSLAILALNSVAVLEADFEVLDGRVSTAIAHISMAASIWQKIKNAVKNAIKAISQHLWQIISTALTLKEWTIKGSLGSSIFGLGSAEISLKFGK